MQASRPAPQTSALTFPKLALLSSERYLIGAHIFIALAALSVGILMGPFQTFRRSPAFMEAWKQIFDQTFNIPIFSYYYQALTAHGVMNALFFTTFFIVGFSYFTTQRSLERPLRMPQLAWAGFWSMLIGLIFVMYTITSRQANVLYTFYPSMVAHPLFYIGLVLLVVGTWMATVVIWMTYIDWRRENPDKPSPLAVFATIANYLMWCLATIPVAIEILFMLLPLSFGWITTTDPQVGRILFWSFGHPLVYFWLIPAYVSWYTMLPKQTNSKLFSDPLARVAFLMLMVFSVPVGVHHLFSDPGVSSVAKGIHTIFTFVVAVPSFLTAFNIGAVLERAGRKRGAKGPFGWLVKQDWSNPVVAAQLCGMILFIAGGFSGIIQASLTLNIALHNTSWVPAHFHMTLAGAVTLTYFGIIYWLVPMIRGRRLWSKKMALAQVYSWMIGMLIFGHGMGAAGLAGAPRRTDLGSAQYVTPDAIPWLNSSAIGGIVLMVSSILFYVNIIGTLVASRQPVEEGGPIDTKGDPHAPVWFERWGFWVGLMCFLVLLAWGPVLVESLDFVNGFNTPGFDPASPIPLGQ
jgi:Heme/copper-type cytochrome/quinol oxidases, subunit 1